jgi:hypothetical protein
MVWLTAIRVCPGTEVVHLKLCNFLCGVHPSCSFSFLSQTIDLHKQHMWGFCSRKVCKKTGAEGCHSLAPPQELECPESSIILHILCKRVKQTPQIRSNWDNPHNLFVLCGCTFAPHLPWQLWHFYHILILFAIFTLCLLSHFWIPIVKSLVKICTSSALHTMCGFP